MRDEGDEEYVDGEQSNDEQAKQLRPPKQPQDTGNRTYKGATFVFRGVPRGGRFQMRLRAAGETAARPRG